jgi:hypothetical protein
MTRHSESRSFIGKLGRVPPSSGRALRFYSSRFLFQNKIFVSCGVTASIPHAKK